MTDPDRRWPRSVYGVGEEPDYRFSLANERTFLAWIRTGLAFLTAGIALLAVSAVLPARTALTHLAAVVLIVCGVGSGVISFLRWIRNERAVRLRAPLPSSVAFPLLTGGLVLVALVALAFLVI